MTDYRIRPMAPGDVDGLVRLHRGCEDPWSNPEECAAWVERRLERDFLLRVAVAGSDILAHGEWLASDEPEGRMLYLGMLQVEDRHQGQGIGRAMIADGEMLARSQGCGKLVTVPDEDTGSEAFYAKCGFAEAGRLLSCTLPTLDAPGEALEAAPIAEVPETVLPELSLRLGLAQACSRHMWEVNNRKPRTDGRLAPAFALPGGGYAQLAYGPQDRSAFALYWGPPIHRGLVRALRRLGHARGLKSVQ
ncbi:MAG TPA: GNAT family N-acetyltransferase, partial [Clostridia bacterium]|nr:GNAT family N-acetyltransferase [Clostridia bacterium]